MENLNNLDLWAKTYQSQELEEGDEGLKNLEGKFENANTTMYEEYRDLMENYYKGGNNTTKNIFYDIDFLNVYADGEVLLNESEKLNKSSSKIPNIINKGKVENEKELNIVNNYYYKKYHVIFNRLKNNMLLMINLFDALKAEELVKSEYTTLDNAEYSKYDLFKDYEYVYGLIKYFIEYCKEELVPKDAIYKEEWGKEGLFRAIKKIFNDYENLKNLGYYKYYYGRDSKYYIILRSLFNDFLKNKVDSSDTFTARMLEIISNYNSLLNALRMRIGEIQDSSKNYLKDWTEKLSIFESTNFLDNFKNLLKENENFKNCLKKFLQFYEKMKNNEKLDKYENLNEILLKAPYVEYFKKDKINYDIINGLIKICNQEHINSNDLDESIGKYYNTNKVNYFKDLKKFLISFIVNYPKDVLDSTKDLFEKATIKPLSEAIKAIKHHFNNICEKIAKRNRLTETFIRKKYNKSEYEYIFDFLEKNGEKLKEISSNNKKIKKVNYEIGSELRKIDSGIALKEFLKSNRKDVKSFTENYDVLLLNEKYTGKKYEIYTAEKGVKMDVEEDIKQENKKEDVKKEDEKMNVEKKVVKKTKKRRKRNKK